MSQKCPAPECGSAVASGHLCCTLHWFVLPIPIRQMVWRTTRYSILHPARREALEAVRQEWQAQLDKEREKEARKRPKTS